MNYSIIFPIILIVFFVFIFNFLYIIFKKIYPKNFKEQEISYSIQAMSVIATVNSLLLAFMAISVWDSYKAADIAAMNEASAIALLGRDLAYYGKKEALAARSCAKDYAKCSIEKDWPLMSKGLSNRECLEMLEKTFDLISNINPKSAKEEVLLSNIWGKANEMSQARRERLQAARSSVPITLWFVAFAGTFLTISMLFVMPRNKFSHVLISIISAAFVLVFYFILAMEKPYAGPDAIKPLGFQRVILNMDNWDKNHNQYFK